MDSVVASGPGTRDFDNLVRFMHGHNSSSTLARSDAPDHHRVFSITSVADPEQAAALLDGISSWWQGIPPQRQGEFLSVIQQDLPDFIHRANSEIFNGKALERCFSVSAQSTLADKVLAVFATATHAAPLIKKLVEEQSINLDQKVTETVTAVLASLENPNLDEMDKQVIIVGIGQRKIVPYLQGINRGLSASALDVQQRFEVFKKWVILLYQCIHELAQGVVTDASQEVVDNSRIGSDTDTESSSSDQPIQSEISLAQKLKEWATATFPDQTPSQETIRYRSIAQQGMGDLMSKETMGSLVACVKTYSTPHGFGKTLVYLVLRVLNAIKAIFGCSTWQTTRRLLTEKIFTSMDQILEFQGFATWLKNRENIDLRKAVVKQTNRTMEEVLDFYNFVKSCSDEDLQGFAASAGIDTQLLDAEAVLNFYISTLQPKEDKEKKEAKSLRAFFEGIGKLGFIASVAHICKEVFENEFIKKIPYNSDDDTTERLPKDV